MDDEETIPDIEDYEQSMADENADLSDQQYEQQQDQQFGTYPNPTPKDSIFTFFKHILGIRDSSKVSNLDKKELGMLDLSVRNCQYLSVLGTLLHNKAYHDFFMAKGEITLATAMSKKGWLPELVVSQKKFSQRTVQPMNLNKQKSGGLFGAKKPEQQQI